MITTREQQFQLGAKNIYRFKIGDYVKVIKKPWDIYKVSTININSKTKPYLISSATDAHTDKGFYWYTGSELEFPTKEELKKFNL